MPNQALRYTIEADDSSAAAATNRVNKANESIGESAERGTKKARSSYEVLYSYVADGAKKAKDANTDHSVSLRNIKEDSVNAAKAVNDYFGSVSLASTTATAAAIAFKGFGAEVKNTGLLISNSINLKQFSSELRAAGTELRAISSSEGAIALRQFVSFLPAIGAAAAIGGIAAATIETAKLVRETGNLVEARANLAAASKLDYQTFNEVEATSRFQNRPDKPTSNYLGAYQALRGGQGTRDYGTALRDLGLGDEKTKATPELLGRIAKSFEDISDPANRAATAYRLFGDQFQQVLPNLNSHLQQSIKRSQEFGETLTQYDSENIYRAKQKVDEFTHSLKSLFSSDDENKSESLKNKFIELAATVINTPVPFRGTVYGKDKEKELYAEANEAGSKIASRSLADSSRRTGYALAGDDAAARPLYEAYRETRDSLAAERDAATKRRENAFEKLYGDQLTPRDPKTIALYTQEVIASSQIINTVKPKIEAIDQAKKDADEAEADGRAVRSSIAARQRQIHDQTASAYISFLDPEAKARAEFDKQTYDLTHIRIGEDVRVIPLSRDENATRLKEFAIEFELVKKKVADELVAYLQDLANIAGDRRLAQNRAAFDQSARKFTFGFATTEQNRQTSESAASFGVQEAGFQRDAELRKLDVVNAQSVKAKTELEQRKLDIEKNYLVESARIQTDQINRQTDYEVEKLRDQLKGDPSLEKEINGRIDALYRAAGEKGRQITDTTLAGISKVQDDAALHSQQIIRDSQLHEFDSYKQSANGLIDALTSRAKTFGEVVGSFFKAAILTPLKEIGSSQIAALIFGAVHPGQSVSFDRSGGGSGIFGKGGAFLGALGLGTQPIFSTTRPDLLGLPNATTQGVSVFDGSQASGYGTGGSVGIFGGAQRLAAQLATGSSLAYAGDGYSSSLDPTSLIGGPGGTSGFSGPVSLPSGVAVAPAGASGGGLFSGITGLFGRNLTPLAIGGIGAGFALSGIFSPRQTTRSSLSTIGGLGALGYSLGSKFGPLGQAVGAEAGIGAGLVIDGTRRRSVLGAAESIGGGALAGAAIGSVVPGIGTLVGAGIGAAVGGISALVGALFGTDRSQMKDQVKSLYRLDINDNIADQLIQIAKSSYGGSFSLAIRSKPAQDLLSLFAQATNQSFLFSNVVRPAYLTESGGYLTQNSQLIGNKAYSFDGALATTNGVPTATIPTYVAGTGTYQSGGQNYSIPTYGPNVSIQLDGEATTRVLQGQIAKSPAQVASAYSQAQSGSVDRRAAAARTLQPGLIF